MSPTESASDDDLMRAFQEGDTPAFEELVRRYRARLAAFAQSHLRDASAADDVVQETFVRVYEEHRDYIPRGRFKAWVYTIARNLCCDRFRATARTTFDLDMPIILWTGLGQADGEPPAAEDEPDERLTRIRAAADELPEPMRETVQLKYYHGLKAREIAQIQDCPLGTVKSRLHYALKRIGEAVTGGYDNMEEE
jgi:RNA polymerase sigma-70 factor (ECF subfamily)